MSMNVKCGDKLSVLIEGSDEAQAEKVLYEFFCNKDIEIKYKI
mgnify:CR=1 FL=1